LLEEKLLNFEGTLLLISHDRAFLNNIVTSTFAFEQDGLIEENIGGYDDWLAYQSKKNKTTTKAEPLRDTKPSIKKDAKKLTYKEQQELAQLPEKIESLEARQVEINQNLADPKFYKDNADSISTLTQELQDLEHELQVCYQRWQELEE
jgi:ATP-binding cassette subfamily F protein uup